MATSQFCLLMAILMWGGYSNVIERILSRANLGVDNIRVVAGKEYVFVKCRRLLSANTGVKQEKIK